MSVLDIVHVYINVHIIHAQCTFERQLTSIYATRISEHFGRPFENPLFAKSWHQVMILGA